MLVKARLKTNQIKSCLWMKAKENRLASSLAKLVEDSSGSALVEFSLLAPILITLWVGVLQFGPLLQNQLIIQNAVNEGAQVMSSGRTDANVYTDTLNQVTAAAGALSGSLSVTLSVCNASGTSCSTCSSTGASSCATLLQAAYGDAVHVAATYPCSLAFGLFDFGSTCALSASESGLIE